jgi:hypothetical protein
MRWFYLGSLFKTEYRYLSVGVILTSRAIDSFPRTKGSNGMGMGARIGDNWVIFTLLAYNYRAADTPFNLVPGLTLWAELLTWLLVLGL